MKFHPLRWIRYRNLLTHREDVQRDRRDLHTYSRAVNALPVGYLAEKSVQPPLEPLREGEPIRGWQKVFHWLESARYE